MYTESVCIVIGLCLCSADTSFPLKTMHLKRYDSNNSSKTCSSATGSCKGLNICYTEDRENFDSDITEIRISLREFFTS